MQLLQLTLPSLAANLACDEALLLQAESGGSEILRLWEWPAWAVVLGAGGKVYEDVDAVACAADQVPITRRGSGGGTVLLGPGCLVFSLVLAHARAEELRQIGSSYRYILGRVQQALAPLVADIEPAGTSDLAIGGRKFSGNSQQRKQTHLLHHGTLLYDFDLSRIARYLKSPPRQPAYRAGRDHADFLMDLPLTRTTIEARLREVWGATEATTDWPTDQVRRLLDEKYEQESWVHRR